MEKAILNIGGKDYELRFTIGFWKRMKEFGIDQKNLETKLQEDFGTVAPQVILASIVGENRPIAEEIDESLDRSVMDVFEQAVINGMTKAEREVLDLAKKQRAAAIAGIENKIDEDNSEKK